MASRLPGRMILVAGFAVLSEDDVQVAEQVGEALRHHDRRGLVDRRALDLLDQPALEGG